MDTSPDHITPCSHMRVWGNECPKPYINGCTNKFCLLIGLRLWQLFIYETNEVISLYLCFHGIFYVTTDYMAELMIFSCNKQLAISGDGNPYFKFYYNLMMVASNLAEGNYITEFQVSRDIVNVVDDRGQTQDAIIPEAINPGPELYPFMVSYYNCISLLVIT